MKTLSLLSLLPLLFSCEPINKYFHIKDDNAIESLAEDAIEYELGAQVDLTPSNPNDGFHIFPRK